MTCWQLWREMVISGFLTRWVNLNDLSVRLYDVDSGDRKDHYSSVFGSTSNKRPPVVVTGRNQYQLWELLWIHKWCNTCVCMSFKPKSSEDISLIHSFFPPQKPMCTSKCRTAFLTFTTVLPEHTWIKLNKQNLSLSLSLEHSVFLLSSESAVKHGVTVLFSLFGLFLIKMSRSSCASYSSAVTDGHGEDKATGTQHENHCWSNTQLHWLKSTWNFTF